MALVFSTARANLTLNVRAFQEGHSIEQNFTFAQPRKHSVDVRGLRAGWCVIQVAPLVNDVCDPSATVTRCVLFVDDVGYFLPSHSSI